MKLKKYFLILVFFLTTPMFSSIVILNGLTHTYKIESGQVYKGHIVVQNTSDNPQNVRFYQQDYRYTSDGTSYYEELGTNPRSNASWIKLSTNLIRLEGKGKYEVFYEITVPDNINNGSFWSTIMVEPVDEIKPSDEKGVRISTVIRYAILLVTTTTQPAEAKIIFESINLTKQEEGHQLAVNLQNQGELYHRVVTSVELFDSQDGSLIGLFSSNSLGLLPNTSKHFTINLNGVPPGNYSAAVLASTEEENIFGVNVELNISDE